MAHDRSDGSPDAHLTLAFSQHVVRLQSVLEQTIAPALAEQGLTPAELDVLATLLSVGAPHQRRPKELANHLLLTTGGLSNVLRRLEARGLVSRVPDPADRRSHNVELTASGLTTARAATKAATTALHRTLAVVPADTLEGTLRQLASVLGAVDGARSGLVVGRPAARAESAGGD
ncbi:MarR family winged helix-turn-helix transcriptional regulator [Lentzea sp. NPDC059081]|uniref:MarR family winged helix-turn-helix transcriptional regulator n=1 Tax=Lentzea sp. NPDC059081 TaxID=3346719 RepID=UPI00368F5D32